MARQGYMLSYGLFKVSHLAGGGSLLVTRIAISISTTYNSPFNIVGGRRVNFNPASEVEMTIFPDSYTFVVQPGREWEAIQTVLTYPNKPSLSTHMDSIAYEKEPGIVWQMVSPAGAPVMVICGNQDAYFMSDEPGLVISGSTNGSYSTVTHYTVKMTFDHYHNGVNYSAIRDDLETFDPEGYHAP